MTDKAKSTIRYALIRQYGFARHEMKFSCEQSDRDYWENESGEIAEAYAEVLDIPVDMAERILQDCI